MTGACQGCEPGAGCQGCEPGACQGCEPGACGQGCEPVGCQPTVGCCQGCEPLGCQSGATGTLPGMLGAGVQAPDGMPGAPGCGWLQLPEDAPAGVQGADGGGGGMGACASNCVAIELSETPGPLPEDWMVGAYKSPGAAGGPLGGPGGMYGAGVDGPLAGAGGSASPVGIVVSASAEACGCIRPQAPQNVWPG